jgi:hypothetical protein
MADDSQTRISIALHGAQIAKTALELMSLSPEFARLQLQEVARRIHETDQFLKSKGL